MNHTLRFGSVCSGIEAASVAWAPLGWSAAWLAEIEPFPSAVLAYHYPEVRNVGDMTKLPAMIAAGEVEAPDVFCGGTPCQAFSVAGLRRSLDDARGNLSLTFCDIANAIDTARTVRGDEPCVVFWENVPGVLSTKDNAFGCFLAGLAGEDDPLVAPGGKWANAGAVFGPARAVAWRTLDAQYFGLAQRRRRVFVVASARKGFDPAQVLFEWDGVRRDTAPSREARQTAPTIPARSTAGGGLGTDFDCDGGVVQQPTFCIKGAAIGRKPEAGPQHGEILQELCYTQNCVDQHAVAYGIRTANTSSNGWGIQEEVTHTLDCAQGVAVAHTLRGEGFDASEDGTGRGTPLVPAFLHLNKGRPDGRQSAHTPMVTVEHGAVPTLTTDGHAQSAVAYPVPFDTTQITSASNYSNPKADDPCHQLVAGGHAPAIAFSSKDHGADATADLAPTLRAMGHAGSHANGGGQMAVAFDTTQITSAANRSNPQPGDACHPLAAGAHAPSMGAANPTAVAAPVHAIQAGALRANPLSGPDGVGVQADHAYTLEARAEVQAVQSAMQVRRLTPTECERLQGFPDDYTLIPWRKRPAEECPDGPRYKALGNSWAVPVARWVGTRITQHLEHA